MRDKSWLTTDIDILDILIDILIDILDILIDILLVRGFL